MEGNELLSVGARDLELVKRGGPRGGEEFKDPRRVKGGIFADQRCVVAGKGTNSG